MRRIRLSMLCAAVLAGPGLAETNAPAFQPFSFACVLRADRLAASRPQAIHDLATSKRDVIILDPCYAPGDRWTSQDLAGIRDDRPGRALLARLAIPSGDGPAAVERRDGWQASLRTEVDAVFTQGFDGLCLAAAEVAPDRRQDVAGRVTALAAYARSRKPGCRVLIQDGGELLAVPDCLRAIDGIIAENVFTENDTLRPLEEAEARVARLRPALDAGKVVLTIEYAAEKVLRRKALDAGRRYGFVTLFTNRDLTALGHSGRDIR